MDTVAQPSIEQYQQALQQANVRITRQNSRIGELYSNLIDSQEINQQLDQQLQQKTDQLRQVQSVKEDTTE